jgi:hypothetical protein
MSREEETAKVIRFYNLRFWLRGLGCCWRCAMRFALAQVEAEAGLKFEAPSDCVTPEEKCADKARAAWKTMPAKPVAQAPTTTKAA